MRRAHCAIVGACSWVTSHTGAVITGLAVVWMTSVPLPVWGQSAWPSYPNNNAISVTGGGNVGIGTTAPASPLDLYHSGSSASDNPGTAALRVTAVTGTNPEFLNVGYDPARHAGYLQPVRSGSGGYWTNLLLNANGGNVGIGTANPQYLLSVKGTVGAEEFIVTNTGWSDYVFQPGYRLRPLSEVGAYIQANHHLPDIPSETEVKEKGVSVGEMQSKLLAKVEELTLHMIQADERNNRLEQQNQELRDRLARLEKGAAASATPTAAK